jgi:predicted transcriptional regulator YdeE
VNPTFQDVPSFALMGITCRNSPDRIDYSTEWGRFVALQKSVEPRSTGDHYYGAYFMVEPESNVVDFVAGMAVKEGTTPADEALVVRAVPGGRYAVFECTMETISETWSGIYGNWEPPKGLTFDPTRPDLEIFAPQGSPESAPVRILVPMKTE